MNNSNPQSGKCAEEMLARNILHQPAWEELLQILGYTRSRATTPQVVGDRQRKVDVEIGFTTNHPPLRFSIKSFKEPSPGNHLERRKLPDYCQLNQISSEDKKFLECLWKRKEKKPRCRLVQTHKEELRTDKIFSAFEPGLSALCGQDHPQVLALYHWQRQLWHLYDMNKKVEPLVRGSQISFTPRGRNICIGDYIIIQRHGSDGPGRPNRANDVQVKMRVAKFYHDVEPCVAFSCAPTECYFDWKM